MEEPVTLLAETVRVNVGRHGIERPVHGRDVCVGPARRGQRGQLRLQRLPGLEDRGEPVPLRHQLHEMT
jgi:hypothetical protein